MQYIGEMQDAIGMQADGDMRTAGDQAGEKFDDSIYEWQDALEMVKANEMQDAQAERDPIYSNIIKPIVEERINFNGSEKAIDFLKKYGLIKDEMKCAKCGRKMRCAKRISFPDCHKWVCFVDNKYCSSSHLRKYSFLSPVPLKLRQWLVAMYNWSIGRSVDFILHNNESFFKKKEADLFSAFRFLREICVQYFLKNPNVKIGGPGKEVLIDRNLSVGHVWHAVLNKNPMWVICIIDITEDKGYIEIIRGSMLDYTAKMNSIIEEVVAEGSTVTYANFKNGDHVEKITKYFKKNPHLLDEIGRSREHDFESYFKQIMWLDVFKSDAFLTLCSQMREYFPLDNKSETKKK